MDSKELLGHEIERFKSYLEEKESGCIEWTGGRFPNGYGSFWFNGKNIGAHRIALLLATDEWPPVVRHTCDNPPCCNPKHLLPGTQKDNGADAIERGRYFRPKGFGTKIDLALIEKVKTLFAEGTPQNRIADITGISKAHVHRIVRGKVHG